MLTFSFRALILLVLVSCASKSHEASLVSPFASSVEGTLVTNVHLVDSKEGKVYRGMRIRNKDDALNLKEKIGMTDVLIFRAVSKGVGVEEEISMLKDLGVEPQRITHIPFEWNKTPSFKLVCEQSFQALELMRDAVEDPSRSLYVHCTVGEDRTGYIAALYEMTFEAKSEDDVFKNEMCAKGYADANAQKPQVVNDLIHANITPSFVKMSYLLRKHPSKFRSLDRSLCEKDPIESHPQVARELMQASLARRCKTL